MAKQTKQQQIIAALKALHGAKEVENARSTKYIVLTRTVNDGGFYYIGRNGSLRVGKTIAGSSSWTDTVKLLLARHKAMQELEDREKARKHAMAEEQEGTGHPLGVN